LGFGTFIAISMDNWKVDARNPKAVRAGLSGTIARIDAAVARAVTHNVPVALLVGTAIRSGYDPVQAASEQEDRRNMQWYTDNGLAAGWWTHSQYARKQRRIQEAYVSEVGKVIAGHMARHPNLVIAATGDGEVELSFERWRDIAQPAPPAWADYSPFTIAEFRDWLRGAGLYGPGQPLDGQGYVHRARYTADASPADDTNRDGHTLNGDFDLKPGFSSWDLRYFDWSLRDNPDADAKAIPASVYTWARWKPMPDRGAQYFDAPRPARPEPGNRWWEVWIRFRQEMVWRHNKDFARWMTTSPDPATGATIPPERWYSNQIPADHVFGFPPPDMGVRLATSASPWWTADVSPFGSMGITAYNVNMGGGGYARTLIHVASKVASRGVNWGLTEWNPSDPWFPDVEPYRPDLDMVIRYRPRLLVPFMWGDKGPWKIEGTGFEHALRELVTRLNTPTESR
jgi:hypothetical protein